MMGCASIGLPSWLCATSINAGLAAGLGFVVDGAAAAGVGAALAWTLPFAAGTFRAITHAAVFVVELFYLTLLEFTVMLVALGSALVRRLRRARPVRGPVQRSRRRPRGSAWRRLRTPVD